MYRYAVIGGGGIGSAAAYWLSRRAGGEVLCLEQWELGHGLGASEDHSRIIRLGYHSAGLHGADPRAPTPPGARWRRSRACRSCTRPGWSTSRGAAARAAEILDAYTAAMDAYGIAYERFDAAELMRRWPQFRLPEDHEALYQPDGGILDIRKAGAVHVALARARGATVLATRA